MRYVGGDLQQAFMARVRRVDPVGAENSSGSLTWGFAPRSDRLGPRLSGSAPQDEAQLVEPIVTLKSHGRVLFVVDRPATIGALTGLLQRSR
jgi:hypothetical protein